MPSEIPVAGQMRDAPSEAGKVAGTRNRPQVSCSLCRRRKLKCDRARPCESCKKRGLSTTCTYSTPLARHAGHGPAPGPDVQKRIRHLEFLVTSLMKNADFTATQPGGRDSESPRNGDIRSGPVDILPISPEKPRADRANDEDEEWERVAESVGRISVDRSQTTYVGAEHWAAILDDITEVKDYFEENVEQYEVEVAEVEASFCPDQPSIFGMLQPLSKDDILASIPPRPVADRLVSRYFHTSEFVTRELQAPLFISLVPYLDADIFHANTFQNQYEAFWQDPSSVPEMWLAQLFAILCLSVWFYKRSGEKPPEPPGNVHDLNDLYRTRTAQCLMLANYTKPKPHTLEALIVYLGIEYLQSKDSQVSLSVLMTIIARLAMHMGYHRDSDHYANISAFDGEMRRRTWSVVIQLEVLLSFQNGIPSTVDPKQCDAKPPRNLLDGDFNEATEILPPSRPPSEVTPVSYSIAKERLLSVFRMIAKQAFSLKGITYEQVMKLDGRLQDVHETMSPPLKIRPVDQSLTDPPILIMQRFNLDLLYQKARCVLHRRYLAKAHSSDRYAYSRWSCIDAASKLLKHQWAIDREIQTGGQLQRDGWYISSLTAHDFILAATIICLEIQQMNLTTSNQQTGDAGTQHKNFGVIGTGNQKDLLEALDTSYEIWNKSKHQSTEACKAARALAVMLGKIQRPSGIPRHKSDSVPSTESPDSAQAENRQQVLWTPQDSLSSHDGSPATGTESTNPATAASFGTYPTWETSQPQAVNVSTPAPILSMEQLFAVPTDIDWDLWDNFMRSSDADAAQEASLFDTIPDFNTFAETQMADAV